MTWHNVSARAPSTWQGIPAKAPPQWHDVSAQPLLHDNAVAALLVKVIADGFGIPMRISNKSCQPVPATAVDCCQMLSSACVIKQKSCRLCPIDTVMPRMWLLQVDLLPKGTDTAAVTEWLLATAGHRRLNVVNAHLVGSPAGQGVSDVASAILRDRKGRSVYVLGAANVGKSSFIRALIR